MAYQVEVEKKAIRELLSLPKAIQERIVEAIDGLAIEPRPPGAKKLTGQEGYRIRRGDYRILYIIDDAKQWIRIYKIGHRREIYR